jgi:hypothetical protein
METNAIHGEPAVREETGYTRREFSRAVTGAAAAALIGTTESRAAAGPPANGEKRIVDDPRIAELEKERHTPLTQAQRSGLPSQLKDLDDSATELRKFALQDGGSEPGFIFRPSPSRRTGG